MFTGILIAQLVEQGKLRYEDEIARYLEPDLIEGLHVFKGHDYSGTLCIEHLLTHTSGLADYYEDKPRKAPSFVDQLLQHPEASMSPEETVRWTKAHLPPVRRPGRRGHYSNTGYNLLGLIIERVTDKPYHVCLHEQIFEPLGMKHTYLLHFSEPAAESEYPVATVSLGKQVIDVQVYKSFSSNYASGQTVSTTEDLLIFMKALQQNRLVSEATYARMQTWNRLWVGVDSGLGLMRLRLLPFAKDLRTYGHLGSTGSFALYHPSCDVYMIGSLNCRGLMGPAARFVLSVIKKIR